MFSVLFIVIFSLIPILEVISCKYLNISLYIQFLALVSINDWLSTILFVFNNNTVSSLIGKFSNWAIVVFDAGSKEEVNSFVRSSIEIEESNSTISLEILVGVPFSSSKDISLPFLSDLET